MKALISPEVAGVMNADYYRPAVSLILPFEPKVNSKNRLVHSIKLAVNKLENSLSQDYPAEVSGAIMQRIKKLLDGLNYGTFKKSIAIFASAAFDKLLYLDQPLEEKIIIDDSFNIRQLIINKKQERQFLLVMLSSKQCCVYLAGANRIERILFKSQAADYSFINAEKEKVSNFTDSSSIKSIQSEKFLLLVDHALHEIISAYNIPVFVLASEKICGHFKQVTKHNRNIFEYIHGNYMDAETNEIHQLLERISTDWDKIKEQHLLRKLEAAADNENLVHGVLSVFRAANSRNGKLLVMEKDFTYNSKYAGPGNKGKSKDEVNKEIKTRDVVDEIIERVLEYGGDVEFVSKNVLKKYQHIALIKFH
jgi:hypothetical protein